MGEWGFAQYVFDGLVRSIFEDGIEPREAFEAAALREGLDNRRLLLLRKAICPPAQEYRWAA